MRRFCPTEPQAPSSLQPQAPSSLQQLLQCVAASKGCTADSSPQWLHAVAHSRLTGWIDIIGTELTAVCCSMAVGRVLAWMFLLSLAVEQHPCIASSISSTMATAWMQVRASRPFMEDSLWQPQCCGCELHTDKPVHAGQPVVTSLMQACAAHYNMFSRRPAGGNIIDAGMCLTVRCFFMQGGLWQHH